MLFLLLNQNNKNATARMAATPPTTPPTIAPTGVLLPLSPGGGDVLEPDALDADVDAEVDPDPDVAEEDLVEEEEDPKRTLNPRLGDKTAPGLELK